MELDTPAASDSESSTDWQPSETSKPRIGILVERSPPEVFVNVLSISHTCLGLVLYSALKALQYCTAVSNSLLSVRT